MKPQVAISLLGTTLDKGHAKKRWDRWRPSVALCQHEDLLIDRLELLFQAPYLELAEQIKRDIEQISPETDVRFHLIEMQNPWDFEEVYSCLHDFSKQYAFAPEAENYFVHITTGTHVAQICLFLLTEANFLPAKLLQTSPPSRGESLPGTHTIIDLDLSQYDLIAKRFEAEQVTGTNFLKSGIQTQSITFNTLIDHIEKVAINATAPILLSGPTGAGKTQLARKIYELKKQRSQISGEFVEINCATLQGEGAMSTLFGHSKGAFTGASTARDGLLIKANKGMLFLDEIGELGLDEQAIMLRAIEEHRFLPLGSDQERHSEFQLIAGSNKNLPDCVSKGLFREDLLARIDLWQFTLPGLSERKEDIAPNIQYELDRFSQSQQRNIGFNKAAYQRYLTFALSAEATWKANFRDLSASITRMSTLAPNGRIGLDDVNTEIARLRTRWGSKTMTLQPMQQQLLSRETYNNLDYIEKVQLEAVLTICLQSNTISEASRTLYNVSRTQKKSVNDADRLRKYLAKYELSWQNIHLNRHNT